MEPLYISIKEPETGHRIREYMRKCGYTVKDVQEAMGFEKPQAVYRWLNGDSLPSIDNLIILSRICHTTVDDLLVINDGDFFIERCPFPDRISLTRNGLGRILCLAVSLLRYLILSTDKPEAIVIDSLLWPFLSFDTLH